MDDGFFACMCILFNGEVQIHIQYKSNWHQVMCN